MPIFEQSIQIEAPIERVDHCITDPDLMKQWLNPFLICESVGPWSVERGSQFRFSLQVPWLKPSLDCVVQERGLGLVEWAFSGFFEGSDRWECQPQGSTTLLINRFSFEIPNPLVQWGFSVFAATLTRKDMQDQLQRLKQVAEQTPTREVT